VSPKYAARICVSSAALKFRAVATSLSSPKAWVQEGPGGLTSE
jgi:hypothetical protein